MRIAAAAIALLAAVSAQAVTIVPGDVAASMPPCVYGSTCVATYPPPVIYLFDHNLQSKGSTDGYLMAFGPNGHLFAAEDASVTEHDTSLAAVRTFTRPHNSTSALTVAQNGNLLVVSPAGVLTIYSPAGAVLQTISLPFTTGSPFILTSLDLGPDQCTLFYTDAAQAGRRYDVCHEQALANLAPGPWNAVRAMSDGGYAAVYGGTLSIFDAQNQLLRAYNPQINTIGSLAFDTDPGFILLGAVFGLARVRLADGVRTGSAAFFAAFLAVNGEQRPAAAPLAADIPTLSPTLLFAVALGLMALAWQRLRA